jgi:HTH-type transcriptional regulator/antitoxin HigA
MKSLRPIKSESEYEELMDWVDSQFDTKVLPNTPEGDNLEMALLLIKDYEDRNYKVPFPDPIEAIKTKMKDEGLKHKDFIEVIGSKAYVSAILNHKKPLTLKIAKMFHKRLGIPAEVLLS